MKHLAYREDGGRARGGAALPRCRTPVLLLQVVTKRTAHRQVLDDECVLDAGQEIQLVEDLITSQRPPGHALRLGRHNRLPDER